MTAERFDLDPEKDRYPLRFEMPLRDVWFVSNGLTYAVMIVSPTDIQAAREAPKRKGSPPISGYPMLAAIVQPGTIDLYPKPTAGLMLEIRYDDEEAARREKECERDRWIKEYRRYHP